MLDPEFWTQGSRNKIYPESLENKLSPCWRFQNPFKIINRVTLCDSKITAVPEPGTARSPKVLHHAGVRNLEKTQGVTASGVASRGLDLQKILQIHWRHAPESFEHKKGYMFDERLLKLSSLRHSRLCSFTIR